MDCVASFFREWVFFGPTVGALIGSFGAWLVAKSMEKKREEYTDEVRVTDFERNRKALASAIIVELQTLKKMYALITDKCFEDMWNRFYPNSFPVFHIEEDYLTVYNTNANKIGWFEIEDARIIVEAVAGIKSHSDLLRQYSGIVERINTTFLQIKYSGHSEGERDANKYREANMKIVDGYKSAIITREEIIIDLIDKSVAVLEKYM